MPTGVDRLPIGKEPPQTRSPLGHSSRGEGQSSRGEGSIRGLLGKFGVRNSPRVALAVASMFVLAAASLVAPAPAGATATGKLDSVTTFAKVPEPGHSYAA